jgi:hypothetical protein
MTTLGVEGVPVRGATGEADPFPTAIIPVILGCFQGRSTSLGK